MFLKTKSWARRKIIKETPLRKVLGDVNLWCWRNIPSLFQWDLDIKKVSLFITTRCNLSCFNCNRSIRQAPTNEEMSLEQIEKFIHESIKLNWGWKSIRLSGGEFALHPQIFEILEILKRYKDLNPSCRFGGASSGFGSKVKEVLSNLPDWINIKNTHKKSNVQRFLSYNIAPIDMEKYKDADFSKGCFQTEVCSRDLTRYGYYPCGPGASIDRVFGFNIGIKELSQVNESKLKEQLKLLCRYCGHYKDNYGADKITEEAISPSWQKAYEEYEKRKPRLSLY